MYGYPNNKPSGFTDDEARQATANALRFWLSEQGEGYSYDFTNRRSNPNAIRAKSGYEHVLEYADELLAKARARQDLPHGVDFSPSTVQLTASENGYVGQTAVLLTNINSGYTLDTSRLPSGSRVSGYTGGRSETLTITLPASAAGQNFSIYAEGIVWYVNLLKLKHEFNPDAIDFPVVLDSPNNAETDQEKKKVDCIMKLDT